MVFKIILKFMREKLEAICASLLFVLLIWMMPIGMLTTIYVLFFTNYWYLAVAYLIWIWFIDTKTADGIGRPSDWVKSWKLFKYAANYFPLTMHIEPGAEFNHKLNYMSCTFPHGIFPIGPVLGFQTNAHDKKPPSLVHTTYGITLNQFFYIPLYRDLILALGLCNANAATIYKLLSKPGGGNVVGLITGGGTEMYHSQGCEYKIVLKNRKGFAKLALKTGCAIVPVFSFGETRLYKQKVFSENSWIRRIQEFVKAILGYPPLIFYGEGLFQKKFGFIPLKTPLNYVVGKPIEVEKKENPTQEDIDEVHRKFVDKLQSLFDKYKYKFEPDPEKSKLIFI